MKHIIPLPSSIPTETHYAFLKKSGYYLPARKVPATADVRAYVDTQTPAHQKAVGPQEPHNLCGQTQPF
jgi:hypothetical protein